MSMRKSQTLSTLQGTKGKLVLGFMGAIAAAIVGSAGVAAAQSMNNDDSMPDKVAMCKDKFAELGFKNVGQCIDFFAHHKGHGYGYGGKGHHHKHHHHNHHGFFGWWGWMQDHTPGQDN